MFVPDGLHLLQVLSPSHLISLLHSYTHAHTHTHFAVLQKSLTTVHSLEKTHPYGTLPCLLAAHCHVLTFLCHNTRLVLINTDLLHLWQHVHVPGAAAVGKKNKNWRETQRTTVITELSRVSGIHLKNEDLRKNMLCDTDWAPHCMWLQTFAMHVFLPLQRKSSPCESGLHTQDWALRSERLLCL